jgi:hypothetical protein
MKYLTSGKFLKYIELTEHYFFTVIDHHTSAARQCLEKATYIANLYTPPQKKLLVSATHVLALLQSLTQLLHEREIAKNSLVGCVLLSKRQQ